MKRVSEGPRVFKVDESHFNVIRRIGPYCEDETYLVTDSISH